MSRKKSFGRGGKKSHSQLLLIGVLLIVLMMLPIIFTDMDNTAEANGVEDGNYGNIYDNNIKINTYVYAAVISMICVLFSHWALTQIGIIG